MAYATGSADNISNNRLLLSLATTEVNTTTCNRRGTMAPAAAGTVGRTLLTSSSYGGNQVVGLQLQRIADRYEYEFRLRVGCANVASRLRQIAEDFEADHRYDRSAMKDFATAIFSEILSQNRNGSFDCCDSGEERKLTALTKFLPRLRSISQVALSALGQRTSAFVGGFFRYVVRRFLFSSICYLAISQQQQQQTTNQPSSSRHHCRFDERPHHSPCLSSAEHFIAVSQHLAKEVNHHRSTGSADVVDLVPPVTIDSSSPSSDDDDDDDDDEVFLTASPSTPEPSSPQHHYSQPQPWYHQPQHTVAGFVSTPHSRRVRFS